MSSETLYGYFCWNEPIRILEILNIFNDIDVFYKNGVYFEFALSNNYEKIIEALLAYFENKQFPNKNEVYERKRKELSEILKDFASDMKLTHEIKKALSNYIDFSDSSSVDSREYDFDSDSDNDLSSTFSTDNGLSSTFPADNGLSSTFPTDNGLNSTFPTDNGLSSTFPTDNGLSSTFPTDNKQDNSSSSKYFELTPGNNSSYYGDNKVENWMKISRHYLSSVS